jgi:hypothetical protein
MVENVYWRKIQFIFGFVRKPVYVDIRQIAPPADGRRFAASRVQDQHTAIGNPVYRKNS